jgi:hypothetical protein
VRATGMHSGALGCSKLLPAPACGCSEELGDWLGTWLRPPSFGSAAGPGFRPVPTFRHTSGTSALSGCRIQVRRPVASLREPRIGLQASAVRGATSRVVLGGNWMRPPERRSGTDPRRRNGPSDLGRRRAAPCFSGQATEHKVEEEPSTAMNILPAPEVAPRARRADRRWKRPLWPG